MQLDRLLCRTLPFAAVLLATMIGAASAQAQGNSIRVDRFSVIDGLTDEMIFDVVQDHDGYMWIATRGGGLNKYDGYTFQHYEFEIENPDWDLADPLIDDLFVDRSGVLWLATESGLKRYHPESDSFSVYRPEPDNPHSLSGSTTLRFKVANFKSLGVKEPAEVPGTNPYCGLFLLDGNAAIQ